MCLRSRTSRHKGLMHLIRCLLFVEATWGFIIEPTYINTKANHLADNLSRNNVHSFLSKVPWADLSPTPVSQPLLDLPSSQSTGGLDTSGLASSVQRYFKGGLAGSTQATYTAALKRFHGFCVQCNVCSPFPVTEQLLCYFLAFLADQGLALQTGKSYLAAIRSMQISLGLPETRDHSSMSILKRMQASTGTAKGATPSAPPDHTGDSGKGAATPHLYGPSSSPRTMGHHHHSLFQVFSSKGTPPRHHSI